VLAAERGGMFSAMIEGGGQRRKPLPTRRRKKKKFSRKTKRGACAKESSSVRRKAAGVRVHVDRKEKKASGKRGSFALKSGRETSTGRINLSAKEKGDGAEE